MRQRTSANMVSALLILSPSSHILVWTIPAAADRAPKFETCGIRLDPSDPNFHGVPKI
jgi:hypothetical protein